MLSRISRETCKYRRTAKSSFHCQPSSSVGNPGPFQQKQSVSALRRAWPRRWRSRAVLPPARVGTAAADSCEFLFCSLIMEPTHSFLSSKTLAATPGDASPCVSSDPPPRVLLAQRPSDRLHLRGTQLSSALFALQASPEPLKAGSTGKRTATASARCCQSPSAQPPATPSQAAAKWLYLLE